MDSRGLSPTTLHRGVTGFSWAWGTGKGSDWLSPRQVTPPWLISKGQRQVTAWTSSPTYSHYPSGSQTWAAGKVKGSPGSRSSKARGISGRLSICEDGLRGWDRKCGRPKCTQAKRRVASGGCPDVMGGRWQGDPGCSGPGAKGPGVTFSPSHNSSEPAGKLKTGLLRSSGSWGGWGRGCR